MIKANELRIGNYVNHNLKGIVKLKGIKPHSGDSMLVLEEGWVYLKNSKPVQLTEQWLIDFGFEKYTWCDDCAFIKINRTFLFVRKFKGKWICQFRYIKKDKNGYYCGSNQRDVLPKGKLKDVHQIQNLYFALTGKELIKL